MTIRSTTDEVIRTLRFYNTKNPGFNYRLTITDFNRYCIESELNETPVFVGNNLNEVLNFLTQKLHSKV